MTMQPTTALHTCPYCEEMHFGDVKEKLYVDALALSPQAKSIKRADDLAALIQAAREAAHSLDRFLQLYDPRGSDLDALEHLQDALKSFRE